MISVLWMGPEVGKINHSVIEDLISRQVRNEFDKGPEKRKHKLPRGVYHYGQCPGRFRAQIVVNKKIKHLGCFDSIILAQKAYQQAAEAHFGGFAIR